jgi:sensor histidine kinase regulating citrate/malate metabolism
MLTLSGVFMTSFIITLSRFVSDTTSQSGMEFSYLSLIVLSIIYQLICITLIFLFNSREKYKSITRIREEYNTKQVEYYKALLVQEEDTRKFRHDIRNHMICIQELLNTNNVDALKEYVKDICYNMDKIVNIYDTGSDIINAIINYYTSKGREHNILVKVKGRMRREINIPMMHLCTVVSNVMSNAYEATLKLEDGEEKTIQVEIHSGSKFFEFVVKNPTIINRAKLDNDILTSKKDKKNHGFGIRNIQEIVLKYDGEFHLIDEADSVTIKIVMKTA